MVLMAKFVKVRLPINEVNGLKFSPSYDANHNLFCLQLQNGTNDEATARESVFTKHPIMASWPEGKINKL